MGLSLAKKVKSELFILIYFYTKYSFHFVLFVLQGKKNTNTLKSYYTSQLENALSAHLKKKKDAGIDFFMLENTLLHRLKPKAVLCMINIYFWVKNGTFNC